MNKVTASGQVDVRQGKATVGTATDQPFIRRVHLAVGAHIRHNYTDYDSLLRTHKHAWLDARAMVQPSTLDKIVEWRDEKDEPDAVEDILREVIVIPDDEDDQSEDDPGSARQKSVEVISSHEYADTVHVRQLDYGALDGGSRSDRLVSPEDDWAPSVKFIRRVSTPVAERRQRNQDRIDRQQAHRTRIWHEAVSRRKNTAPISHDLATRQIYQSHNERFAASNTNCLQMASSAPHVYGSHTGRTESRSVYTNHEITQPFSESHDRRWAGAMNHVSEY